MSLQEDTTSKKHIKITTANFYTSNKTQQNKKKQKWAKIKEFRRYQLLTLLTTTRTKRLTY